MTTSTALLPRSCPRCVGRLFHSRDRFGGYSSCMACGFVHEWVAGPAVELPGETDGPRRLRHPVCEGRPL